MDENGKKRSLSQAEVRALFVRRKVFQEGGERKAQAADAAQGEGKSAPLGQSGGGDGKAAAGADAGGAKGGSHSREIGGAGVKLGDVVVDPYGLGTLPLGVSYPDPAKRPSEDQAIAIVHAALEGGCQLIDVADSYCAHPPKGFHETERMLCKALTDHTGACRKGVYVATKAGMNRISPESNGWRPTTCDYDYLYGQIKKSHQALGGKQPIFLWQLHHPNEKFTRGIEDSLDAARVAVREGLVTHVGLCNVTVEQIERARKIVEIVSVQNEYSLWQRKPERDGTLEYCTQHGLAFLPHGTLGGLKSRRGERDMQEEFPALHRLARDKNVSPQALILQYMRQKWPCIIHIPGARTIEHVRDVRGARHVTLTPSEMSALDATKPQRKKK